MAYRKEREKGKRKVKPKDFVIDWAKWGLKYKPIPYAELRAEAKKKAKKYAAQAELMRQLGEW